LSWRRYFSDLRQFGGGRLLGLGALTLVAGAADSLGLLMLVPLLELVGAGPRSSHGSVARDAFTAVGLPFTLASVLLVYVLLTAVRSALVRMRSVSTARLQMEFVDWQRLRVFEAVAHADWAYQVSHRSSDVLHGVMADIGRIGNGTNLILQSIIRLIMAGAYVVVALRLSVPLTLVAAVGSVVLSAVLFPLVRRSRRLGERQTVVGRQAFGSLSEFFAGMKIAKVHGAEAFHIAEFRTAVADLRASQFDFQRTQAFASAVNQVAIAASLAALVWIGVEVVKVTTPELLALIVVLSRILPVAGGLVGDFRGAVNMQPAYLSAMAMLDEAEAAAERPVRPGPKCPLTDAVELRDIVFTYAAAGRPAVDGVSLRIPARATTALVGPSGAGKTTLADIVLGLLHPDSGVVTVDGRPLDEIDLGSWRASVSYVPQDPFLFHATLRENVCWAAPGLDDSGVVDLLQRVGLAKTLAQLPAGIETVVGERGHRLSGGERQRVVLARALARKPTLLVLDEATSHLDVENEVAARTAIEALHGGVTVLLIAHRLNTVRHADQIVVLEGGRISELGSWDDLAGRRGRFAEMLVVGQGG
jgi:ATP-binding cassette subfamily C protein